MKKEKFFQAFVQVAKAVNSTLSLSEVLNLLVTNVAEVMEIKGCAVRLLGPFKKKLEMVASHGLSPTYIHKGPVDADKSIQDALDGKLVSIFEVESDERVLYADAVQKEGIKTILSVPLKYKAEVIGVLRMYMAEKRELATEELEFVSVLADQGALAIENARIYERMLTKERQYLRIFQDVTKAVTSTLAVNEVLNMVVTKVSEAMGLKACALRLLDKTRKKLELVASHGLSEPYINKGPVDADKSLADAVEGRVISILDATTDPRAQYPEAAEEEGIRTIVSIPIQIKGKVIGVLRMYTGEPRQFTLEEIDFVQALAEQGAIAIENAKMFERLRKDYKDVMSDIYQFTGYRRSI